MDYVPDKDVIARRIARIFRSGDVVNLGIGLPTQVVNHLPPGVAIILQSENGLMGLGPAPAPGQEDRDMVNAGGAPITVQPGGCFFDSATSFGIIRGGHVDYTVLGVLEVDQEGNLANYKVPGKMVPGMGGAMDLTIGARKVIAATLHFEPTGASRLRRRCALPLTAAREVDLVVTDLGLFEVKEGRFLLRECLGPYPPDWIRERTDADIDVADGAWPA
ncbi:3-oxoacid CoA-transferase subunit B [Mesoterricola silvestris]|uniref:Succinyl-CoA--3-ketoacid-CoA transferase n=1 Tax=Mesoterricola silvestris TaxID=2927979 RepID=A0AA48GV99_9BACT|nr:3-oxoacid CoA-transferase subunit B [Mesoterricola silvestris]BDU74702.1 succinyl-CoA--3-ketoacid-CoA transferase [Mesoterricola silvestris]